MRRPRLAVLAALAVATIAAGAWWATAGQFDPEAWQANRHRPLTGPPRIDMIDDLLERHELVGRPRATVVALLGEPEETDYFREYDMVYWLGPERGLISIDSEWLVLRLSGDGRVTERRVVSD